MVADLFLICSTSSLRSSSFSSSMKSLWDETTNSRGSSSRFSHSILPCVGQVSTPSGFNASGVFFFSLNAFFYLPTFWMCLIHRSDLKKNSLNFFLSLTAVSIWLYIISSLQGSFFWPARKLLIESWVWLILTNSSICPFYNNNFKRLTQCKWTLEGDALTSWRWPCSSWTSQTDGPFPVTECKPARGRHVGYKADTRTACPALLLGLFFFYLQNKVHHSFVGLEKQLLEANTQHFPFQSVSHCVTDAQFVANLIQTRLPGRGNTGGR